MRNRIVFVLAWTLAAAAAPCHAVVIFPKGGRAPIKASLVSQDDKRVVYRETRPDGSTVEREIYHSEIEDMIVTISPERLQSLGPDHPSAYRDYAEELAEKREDPDARETGIRLYLIAAWLDPARLGPGCLLGITGLARTPAEERKFRAMAYLLDPQHDRRLLKPPESAVGTVARASAALPEGLLKPLILLRQGKDRAAMALARQPAFRNQLDQIKDFFSYDEFLAACQSCHRDGRIPPELLRKILQLELASSGMPRSASEPEPARDTAGRGWSETVRLGWVAPMPSLSLETVTEFDPRKCVFRDGQWVEPKQ